MRALFSRRALSFIYEVAIGPAGSSATVRVSYARCGVRVRMRVVYYTLSMYFLPGNSHVVLKNFWGKPELVLASYL